MSPETPTISSDPVGLVSFIARNLIDSKKGEISINPIAGAYSLVLELQVEYSEIGRLVGKNGRIKKAIKHLLHSIPNKSFVVNGSKERFQEITLEIVD